MKMVQLLKIKITHSQIKGCHDSHMIEFCRCNQSEEDTQLASFKLIIDMACALGKIMLSLKLKDTYLSSCVTISDCICLKMLKKQSFVEYQAQSDHIQFIWGCDI